MKRAEHQLTLPGVEDMKDTRCQQCADMGVIIDTACQSCKDIEEFENLMSGQLTSLPKIDMGSPFVAAEEAQEHYGQGVSPEEKRGLWPNEERIDIIGSNGNDGLVYEIGGGSGG